MSNRKRVRVRIPDKEREALLKKHRKKQWLLWGSFAASLALGGYTAWQRGLLEFIKPKPAKVWFDSRAQVIEVELPRDEASHPDTAESERWSYSGELTTPEGARYSFHSEVFLLTSMLKHTVIHSALMDHKTGRHYTDSYRTAGNPSASAINKFRFSFLHAQMAGANGNDRLQLNTDKFSYKLKLHNPGLEILHYNTGKVVLLDAGTLHYYSRPRMTVKGFIQIGKQEFPVSGQAWFDHHWNDFRMSDFYWRWFALNLDDGTDILIYQLYDDMGLPVSGFATIQENHNTAVITLSDADFVITRDPAQTWQGSGYSYALTWSLKIPDFDIDLSTTPVSPSGEFNGRNTAGFSYWKGAIRVAGSHRGRGFMELRTPRAQMKKTSEGEDESKTGSSTQKNKISNK